MNEFNKNKYCYAFVGDKALGLDMHLRRPYSGTHLPDRKKNF